MATNSPGTKKTMKTEVYDLVNGAVTRGIEFTYDLPSEDTVNGIGCLITPRAADRLINNRFSADLALLNADPQNDVGKKKISFDVGRAALLLLLSQKGCEGLRITLCKKDDENKTESLIIMGLCDETVNDENGPILGKDGKPLYLPCKKEHFNATSIGQVPTSAEPFLTEEVHGNTLIDYVEIKKAVSGQGITITADDLTKLYFGMY